MDQTTAVVGKEPLETLHTFRTGAGLGWAEASGGLCAHVAIAQMPRAAPRHDAMEMFGTVIHFALCCPQVIMLVMQA